MCSGSREQSVLRVLLTELIVKTSQKTNDWRRAWWWNSPDTANNHGIDQYMCSRRHTGWLKRSFCASFTGVSHTCTVSENKMTSKQTCYNSRVIRIYRSSDCSVQVHFEHYSSPVKQTLQ